MLECLNGLACWIRENIFAKHKSSSDVYMVISACALGVMVDIIQLNTGKYSACQSFAISSNDVGRKSVCEIDVTKNLV